MVLWMTLFLCLSGSVFFQGTLVYLDRAYQTDSKFKWFRRFVSLLGLPSVMIMEMGVVLAKEMIFQSLMRDLPPKVNVTQFPPVSSEEVSSVE